MSRNTPPMGWNSWNTFGKDIDEKLIRQVADKLKESGLAESGYQYLIIDDCWSLRKRDKNGRLVANPEKFPSGIKALSDYINSKGLKFGMYSCCGNLTCAGYPGSYEHEFTDAATFAQWGVDYLKYDYCYQSKLIHSKYLYRRMGIALKNCGREILFSACSWGADNTAEWIRECGVSAWRSTGDIFDTWESVKKIADAQESIFPYGGKGCFNDMDMLVVGMYGSGNVGLEGLTDTQYRTHFSLWAFLGSPLILGCDIRNMSDSAYEIVTNRELIEINQDEACCQTVKIKGVEMDNDMKCYMRLLDNGDIAVGCFNLSDRALTVRFNSDELGLPLSTGKTLRMHNVWNGEICEPENGTFMRGVDAYDCLVFRCKISDLK